MSNVRWLFCNTKLIKTKQDLLDLFLGSCDCDASIFKYSLYPQYIFYWGLVVVKTNSEHPVLTQFALK